MAPLAVVKFDVENGVFFPGQTVSGIITVVNEKLRKCEGVSIKFKGHALVRFTETKYEHTNEGSKQITKTYTAAEEYYNSKYLVWSDPSQQLQPGEFQFNFSFILPVTAPASFQCKFGHVEHFCEATVKLPMAKDAYCKRPYSVNSLLDLNMDPNNRIAQTRQNSKTLCCLCCRSGPITAQVRLNRVGYVPGESIFISAEVTNHSNRKVTSTVAELHMKVLLIAVGRTRMESYQLMELKQGEISEGDDCIWSGHGMVIPPIPASGLLGCNIINVTYSLKFIVSPQLPAKSLVIEFPIFIGSIPLQETFQHFMAPAPMQPPPFGLNPTPSAPPAGAIGGGPGSFSGPDAPPQYMPPLFPGLQQYPDLPPPTYSQAVSEGMTTGLDSQELTHLVPPASGMPTSGFTPTYLSYTIKGLPYK